MGRQVAIEWMDAGRAVRAGAATAPFARVLVCDLRDPARRAASGGLRPMRAILRDAELSRRERALVSSCERRAALRTLAARCAGVEPETRSRSPTMHEGAPRVSGANLFVSASSRGARAALAVASSPVGRRSRTVRRERAGDRGRAVQGRAGGAGPRARAPNRRARSCASGRAKEAYLKALGRGFKRNPALDLRQRQSAAAFRHRGHGRSRPELAAGGYAPQRESGDLIVASALLRP